MQFEQQNPLEVFVMNYQFRDKDVQRMYAEGPMGQLGLRLKMQSLMIPERMRQLRSPEEMDLDCFTDWKVAFEVILAMHRLSAAPPSPTDQHLLILLANHMLRQDHMDELRWKLGAFVAGALALAAVPRVMHWLGIGSKKQQ